MGCKECGKPKCNGECGCKSPKVLQINNPAEYITFHKVSIPAAMGDSTTNPPKIGAYRNALVYYEADHTSWMYSTDGIPTKLTNGLTDYNEAVNLPQINGHTLIGNQSSSDLGLQGKLTAGNGIELYGTEIGAKIGGGLEFGNDGEIDIADIEQYAHFFDNVAEMQAADLSNGEFAVTAGYYAANDGGGANYKIINSSETADGGSIIALSNGLKAQLIVENDTVNIKQFGAKGNGTTDDSTAIDNALAFNDNNPLTIVFNGDETYLVSGYHYFKSNTTLDLNGSKILCSGIGHWYCDPASTKSAGYTGITNVNVKNGTFEGGACFVFFHSTNIKFEDILFDDANKGAHLFDLGGVKGFKLLNCEVYGNGNKTMTKPSIETIQTDHATSGGMPYFENATFDNIPTRDVLIENCYFHKKDGDQYYLSAIGNHSHDISAGVTDAIQNVTIRRCKFEGWYRNAIRFIKIVNLLIEGCEFIPKELQDYDIYSTQAIVIQSDSGNYGEFSNENIVIRNNRMIASSSTNAKFFAILDEEKSNYKMKNVLIEGNEFNGYNGTNFLEVANIEDIVIRDNTVYACEYFLNKANSTYIEDLTVSDNIVYDFVGFIRSALSDGADYYAPNHLNENNNILRQTIDGEVLNLNTSSFLSVCSPSKNQTFNNANNSRVIFDVGSSKLAYNDTDGIKIQRSVRKIKIGGKLTVKTASGASLDKIQIRIWDMKVGANLGSKIIQCSGATYTNWRTIELPEFYIDDIVLGTRASSGPRYVVNVEITSTGNIEISKDDTELIVSNW